MRWRPASGRSRCAGGREQRLARASDRLARLEGLADATQASAEAFDTAMLTIEDGQAQLAWGGDCLNLVATVLGLDEAAAAPQAVIDGADGAPMPTIAAA